MWELDCEESWTLKNWCFWTVVLDKTLASPLDCKEIQPVHSEGDRSWGVFGRNDAKAETSVLWPPHAKSWLIGKDWCWEGLGAGEEGDDRGWDGWMASLTQWTWVWVNSGSWWWTGRPGMLRFMGSQRVGHDWETELNWKHKHVRTGIMADCHFPLFSAEYKKWLRGYSSKHQFLNIFLNTLEKSKLLEWQKLTAWVAVVIGYPWARVFTVNSWWWRAHENTGVHTGHLHSEQVQLKLQKWS